jgi:hypothetical protein
MVREDVLISKMRTLLGQFFKPMQDHLGKPRKQFLLWAIRGILFPRGSWWSWSCVGRSETVARTASIKTNAC